MNALIFAGGQFDGIPQGVCLETFSLILAADKGYSYAESLGIVPHIFVGDFDSFCDDSPIKSAEIFRLETEKDMTDTQKAIEIAISRGAHHILILGALGGRIDHTFANIQLLKFGLDRGVSICLADANNFVTLTKDAIKIPKQDGWCLSLLPLTPCRRVTAKGVYYPLLDASMELGISLGVSNEFTEDFAEISLESGLLLVMVCRK